jgi:hypothetical protein
VQLKLAEHQLAEFEEREKSKDMFRLPGNMGTVRIPAPPPLPPIHQAVTRSMVRQGLGSPLVPAGEFTARAYRAQPPPLPIADGMGFENPAFHPSPQAVRQLLAPTPPRPHPIRIVHENIEMRNLQPNIAMRPAVASPPMGGRITGLRRLQNQLAPPRAQAYVERQVRPPVGPDSPTAAIANAVRVGRRRHVYDNLPELPLAVNRIRRPNNFLFRGGRFLKKYKRKILLGAGAVLGGTALIAGLALGLKKKKEEKETIMREGNTGTLGQLVKGGFGGGRGGGGGSYSSFAAGRYYSPAANIGVMEGIGKKLKQKKQRRNKPLKKKKNSNKSKSINKRSKKGKSMNRKPKKRFAVF